MLMRCTQQGPGLALLEALAQEPLGFTLVTDSEGGEFRTCSFSRRRKQQQDANNLLLLTLMIHDRFCIRQVPCAQVEGRAGTNSANRIRADRMAAARIGGARNRPLI